MDHRISTCGRCTQGHSRRRQRTAASRSRYERGKIKDSGASDGKRNHISQRHVRAGGMVRGNMSYGAAVAYTVSEQLLEAAYWIKWRIWIQVNKRRGGGCLAGQRDTCALGNQYL